MYEKYFVELCMKARQGQVAGTCECGNERSGSIKCGKCHD